MAAMHNLPPALDMDVDTHVPMTPALPRMGLSSYPSESQPRPLSLSYSSLDSSDESSSADYYNIGPLHRFQRNKYRGAHDLGATFLSSSSCQSCSVDFLSVTSSVSHIVDQDTSLGSFLDARHQTTARPVVHPASFEATLYTIKGLSVQRPRRPASCDVTSSSLSSDPLNSCVLESESDLDMTLGPRPPCVGQAFTPCPAGPASLHSSRAELSQCAHRKVESWLSTQQDVFNTSQDVLMSTRKRHAAVPNLHHKLPPMLADAMSSPPYTKSSVPESPSGSTCWRSCKSHDQSPDFSFQLDSVSVSAEKQVCVDSDATTFLEGPLTQIQPITKETGGPRQRSNLSKKLKSVGRRLQKLRRPSSKAGLDILAVL